MQALFDHIDTVKGKPHHVRRQVAFAVAAVIAGVVGLGWLGLSLSMGAFAIEGSSFAESTGALPAAATVSGNSQLAGSAAAFSDEDNAPAHIQIVDTTPSSAASQPEQTVIPF